MSNITENKLNATIVAADVTAINTSIATIASKLPIRTLDEEQRGNLRAINIDNKVFVEDVIMELGVSGAGIVPAFINASFIQNDLALFQQIDAIEASLSNLLQKTADLKRIAGHEAYATALTVYKIYDAANQAGIDGAKQGYDKLKSRFEAQGRPVDMTV